MLFGPPCEGAKDNPIHELEETLKAMPDVKLVIIDPIFKFLRVHDVNEYAPINSALQLLMNLGRRYGVHIMTVHHQKKRDTDHTPDGSLGSTAINGGVDVTLSLTMGGRGARSISSSQRYGKPIEETQLDWNPDIRELSLGMTTSEVRESAIEATGYRVEEDLLRYVTDHPGCSQQDILRDVPGKGILKLHTILKLVDEGVFTQSGKGIKGSPYTYSTTATESWKQSSNRPQLHRNQR
jgi:hypothetical protein